MRFAFRCDSSLRIGSGHVMRCLALAETLSRHSHASIFFCRELEGNVQSEIRSRGYEVQVLSKPSRQVSADPGRSFYAEWLEVSLDQEIRDFAEALERSDPFDWIVVDHYALDQAWETRARNRGAKLLVIDDLANRPHDCEILLDQNFFQTAERRYGEFLPENAVSLLGPRFALLRQEFRDFRTAANRRSKVNRILVATGASDRSGAMRKCLEALRSIPGAKLEVTAILGAHEPDREFIEKSFAAEGHYKISGPIQDFARHMLASDLYIGAGGTTTWERLCLGLPGIVIATAENQEQLSTELSQAGFGKYLGRSAEVSASRIREAVEEFLANPESLGQFSEAGMRLVDGEGTERVTRWLEIAPIQFRPANLQDAELLWKWANDPLTRASAFNTSSIPWDSHLSWLEAKLKSPESRLLIAETCTGAPLGQIRFDLQRDSTAVIDVSVAPEYRSLGMGKHLIAKAVSNFWDTGIANRVVAWVKDSNIASRLSFSGAGFEGAPARVEAGESIWRFERHKGKRTP